MRLAILGDNLEKTEKYTLEGAIKNRRTIREISGKRIPSHRLEKLLWAAYGKTLVYQGDKYRTAPSAGATYPIELYVFVERIDGFDDGIYIYNPDSEKVEICKPGIYLPEVQKMSWDQEFISLSNAVFVMVYNPRKIESEYGNKNRERVWQQIPRLRPAGMRPYRSKYPSDDRRPGPGRGAGGSLFPEAAYRVVGFEGGKDTPLYGLRGDRRLIWLGF
jgi:hypothetical protein